MKTSNLLNKIVMAVLFAGVLIYLGIYLVQSLRGGVVTVLAYADTVNVGVEATGLLVREESVVTAATGGATVDLSLSEGEKVAAGGTVATLYSSSSGLETKQSITQLEAELEQLEYSRSASAAASDTAQLEEDLLAAIAGLHASAARGDLTDLESDTLELRTLVFKRDYTYGDTIAAAELDALIASKSAELNTLRASLGSVSTTIRASQGGVFSGLVDGFESLITPAMLDSITPSQLQSIQRQSPTVSGDAIGKLITDSTWYFTAVLDQADAEDLYKGQTYTLVFSHDYSGEIDMTLERISDPEDGQVALVFSCRTHLSDTTLLRQQTVDIVTEQLSGLRVPRSALRVDTSTVTDEETGQSEEVSVTGVFAAVGSQAEFKPVNVLYQGEDYYLVEPVDPASATRLREDDEIILNSKGLYDGKVIR